MRSLFVSASLIFSTAGLAQGSWVWQERAPIPMPTANNAVCAALVDGDERVYSFGGIGVGLDRPAIHREAYRYSSLENAWTVLPQLPDTSGKIASSANVVDGVAYVLGGYHVLAGSPFEVSSNRVHRLDLSTETWMQDGAPIPFAIDDQVQAVWRDSLIYVITGWSNTTNVAAVQIYDVVLDAWSVGTPVPNNNQFKAFGASGTIIGDTIYYYGGASTGSSFPAQDKLRIGVIDSSVPTSIEWLPVVSTGRPRYRTACGEVQGRPFWVGGSAVSYNYDAVAYNGSGVVAPSTDLAVLPNTSGSLVATEGESVMDLRGIGMLSNGSFHVCGGIGPNAEVLSSNWLVAPTVGVPEIDGASVRVYPVPSAGAVTVELPSDLLTGRFEVYNSLGALVQEGPMKGPLLQLDMPASARGSYTLKLIGAKRVTIVRFWLV